MAKLDHGFGDCDSCRWYHGESASCPLTCLDYLEWESAIVLVEENSADNNVLTAQKGDVGDCV